MRIEGIVSKVVPSKGTFVPKDAAPGSAGIDYDHDLVTILVDGLDPVEVKVKRAQADTLPNGTFVRGQRTTVEVSVPKGVRLDFQSLAQPAKV